MSRNIVIALSGWKQSGKDTTADFIEDLLTENFNYASNIGAIKRSSFATPIKEIIDILFNVNETSVVDKEEPIKYLKKYFKEAPSYRYLTILLGEGMKKLVHNNVWVYALENSIKKLFSTSEEENAGDKVFLIPDVRYMPELKMLERLKKRGYEVYYYAVIRSEAIPDWAKIGLDPSSETDKEIIVNDFSEDRSEYEWCINNNQFTGAISNNGSKSELKQTVEESIIKKIWK